MGKGVKNLVFGKGEEVQVFYEICFFEYVFDVFVVGVYYEEFVEFFEVVLVFVGGESQIYDFFWFEFFFKVFFESFKGRLEFFKKVFCVYEVEY